VPVGLSFRLPRARMLLLGLLAILLVRVVTPVPAEAIEELLLNRTFEPTTPGWKGSYFAIPGSCIGRTGSAGTLNPDNTALAVVQQDIKVNGGAGPFTLTGFVKLQAGDATVRPVIRWLDAGGTEILTTAPADVLLPDATYRSFSTIPATAPLKAVTAQIRTTAIATDPATVCVDDFSFTGPAFVQLPPTSVPHPTTDQYANRDSYAATDPHANGDPHAPADERTD
jgi:hypothetical protein